MGEADGGKSALSRCKGGPEWALLVVKGATYAHTGEVKGLDW